MCWSRFFLLFAVYHNFSIIICITSIYYIIVLGYNYLKKSCDQNDEMACHYLCGMYLTGVPKNVAEYNPHNPEKNKNLEYLIKPDMKQAFNFAKKACDLGNMYGCANVSMMYKKGEGVEKNPEESKRYFEIAQALQKAHETTKEIKFQQGLDGK